MFQWWTLRRGHRTVVWSESVHVPIGISGPAGWSPAAFRLPIHTAGEREDSSSVHSCQKGTARPPPLPVGASCGGSQRSAPAASIFLGQNSFGTKPQALEKKGTGLRFTRLRGHTGLSSRVIDMYHSICFCTNSYDPRLALDLETKGLTI